MDINILSTILGVIISVATLTTVIITSDGVITMWGTGTITSNITGHSGNIKAILPITISKMLICVGNMGTTVNGGIGSIMEVKLSNDGSYITGAWDSFNYSNSPTKWRYLLKGVV